MAKEFTGELEIRPALGEELADVLELWDAARSRYSTTPDSRGVIDRLRAGDPEALLVALRDGQVIGTLIAAWDGWRGNMYRLAVASDDRRRGAAIALVRAGERRLYECGARRLTGSLGRESAPQVAAARPCSVRARST